MGHTTPAGERLAKWDRKFNTARIKEMLDEARPQMKSKIGQRFIDLAAVEDSTKNVLNNVGVSVATVGTYLCFAREVWSADNKYEAETLKLAVQTLIDKWVERGMSQTVLDAIREQVFTIGTPVTP